MSSCSQTCKMLFLVLEFPSDRNAAETSLKPRQNELNFVVIVGLKTHAKDSRNYLLSVFLKNGSILDSKMTRNVGDSHSETLQKKWAAFIQEWGSTMISLFEIIAGEMLPLCGRGRITHRV